MPTIAVVFHSGYGHTQRMAQAVAQGAGAELIAIDAEGNFNPVHITPTLTLPCLWGREQIRNTIPHPQPLSNALERGEDSCWSEDE